jgi:hypothetical protein
MQTHPPPKDFWPREREGFSANLRPAYAAVRVTPSPRRSPYVRREEQLGAIVAGAGLCWAASVAINQFATVYRLGFWPPGPLELCAAGVLIWIHARWRRAVKVH